MDSEFKIDFQRLVIKLLCTNVKFCMEYGADIKAEYFENEPLRIIFRLSSNHIFKYEKEIYKNELFLIADEYLTTKGLSESNILSDEISHIFASPISSEQFVIDRTTKFIRRQRLKEGLIECIEVMERNGDLDDVQRIMDKATSVCSGGDEGLEFSDFFDFPHIYREYYNPATLIKTGFPSFDRALKGGMGPAEVHVIQASPKTGKSTLGSNIGVNVLATGRVVYHITLEISKLEVASKYVARISGWEYERILESSVNLDDEKEYIKLIKKFGKCSPNIFINFWPERSVNCLNIRSWISKKRAKTGLSPNLIIVDYDDCLSPIGGSTSDMYEDAGRVYSDLISMGVYFKCFSHDTEIPLANGTVRKISDISPGEEIFVYSMDNNKVVVEKAVGLPPIYNNEDLLEITLDNDEVIKCTPDHKFMMRDGSYREAKHLKPEDSLMPIYKIIDENGYECCKSGSEEKFSPTHKIVANQYLKEQKNEIRSITNNNRYLVVHHKNTSDLNNKRNNYPCNLEWMGEHDHWKLHSEQMSHMLKRKWSEPGYRDKKIEQNRINAINLNKDLEFSIRKSLRSSRVMIENNNNPIFKENVRRSLIRDHASGARTPFPGFLGSDRNSEIGKKTTEYLNEQMKIDPVMKQKHIDGVRRSWDSIDRRIMAKNNMIKTLNNLWGGQDFRKSHTQSMHKAWEIPSNFINPKIINLTKKIINLGLELNKENYDKYRVKGIPTWENALKIFSSVENLIKVSTNNHKIKMIRKINKENLVYCLSVPRTKNFLLKAGVVVANCPILTFAQPRRDAWSLADTGELIHSYQLAHSAKKAHKAYSISSMNFPEGALTGILYADLMRRGTSCVKIPIKRDLDRAYIGEIYR